MLDYSNRTANLTASSCESPSASGMDGIEENFTKVALALNQHSKAVVGLREQLAAIEKEHRGAFDQLSRAINTLHERLAQHERAATMDGGDPAMPAVPDRIDQLSRTTALLREQLIKLDARCASNFDLLSKATSAAHEKLTKLDEEIAEGRPQIAAIKVHTESFPHALRAARRSDAETQETLKAFDARLRKLESRSSKVKAQT
ncbi:MAG: hypothetical protein ACRD2P_13190 [Terriglobia bacterium]